MTSKVPVSKDEFLDQFAELNAHIESALEMHDFDRARRIDSARRQMLHDFASTAMPDGDKMFFDTLERCAADNARAITQITSEMGRIRRQAGRKMRQLNGYRASRPSRILSWWPTPVADRSSLTLPLQRGASRSSVFSFSRSEWSGAASALLLPGSPYHPIFPVPPQSTPLRYREGGGEIYVVEIAEPV